MQEAKSYDDDNNDDSYKEDRNFKHDIKDNYYLEDVA